MSQRKPAKPAQTTSGSAAASRGIGHQAYDKAMDSAPFYTVPAPPIPGRTSWSLAP